LSELFGDEVQNKKMNEQLMESFEVEKDVMSKFSQGTAKEVVKTEIEKIKSVKAEKKITKNTKTVKKKKSVKKVVKVSKKTKIAKMKISKPVAIKPVVTESKYPEDYPESLVKINQTTEKFWPNFKPVQFVGEKTYLDINYMGLSTGKIVLETKPETTIGDSVVYHISARIKTARYYRYLYELDDTVDSYLAKSSFTPVKFSLIQRESSQDIDDLQLFDLDKLLGYTFYKRVTKKKTKKKQGKSFIPERFQDPVSILYFLRGFNFSSKGTYKVPILNKGKVTLLEISSQGSEKIKTELGKIDAYKLKAVTTYTGDTIKKGDMFFWFSKDERRILLRFKAQTKIGAISGEIEKYSK